MTEHEGKASLQANVYVKVGAAIATATASGAVTITDLETAVDVLEEAHERGASPEEALEELQERAPSVAEQLRDVLGKPVTWGVLSFVVNLARLLLDVAK